MVPSNVKYSAAATVADFDAGCGPKFVMFSCIHVKHSCAQDVHCAEVLCTSAVVAFGVLDQLQVCASQAESPGHASNCVFLVSLHLQTAGRLSTFS